MVNGCLVANVALLSCGNAIVEPAGFRQSSSCRLGHTDLLDDNSPMSNLWSGFAGVVIGAVVAGVTSWLTTWFSAKKSADTARIVRRNQAYTSFLANCGLVMFTADSLRLVASSRSGVKESVAAIGGRAPLDGMDVIDLLRRDLDPLYHAWSQVWTVGTQAAIRLANEIVGRAADLLKAGSEPGKARGSLATAILGPAWTADQICSLQADIKQLAELRRDFADLVRRETGEPAAALFSEEVGQ